MQPNTFMEKDAIKNMMRKTETELNTKTHGSKKNLDSNVSARSVVVTYKLPMLVPRVRFPACALYFPTLTSIYMSVKTKNTSSQD